MAGLIADDSMAVGNGSRADRRAWLKTVAVGCVWQLASAAVAGDGSTFATGQPTCRAHDQIWLVNTRSLDDCPCAGAAPKLDYCRFDHGKWIPGDAATFHATARPTTRVWVHGNRIDAATATDAGWDAYRVLATADAAPLRFVIWSWPSDKVRGQLRDVRTKACRTEGESYYLARWLQELAAQPSAAERIADRRANLDLVGYSYGARVITGALHLFGGGESQGRRAVPDAGAATPNIRSVLLASAIEDDWLLPGGRHDRAVPVSSGVLSLHNTSDPVLRWFRIAARDRSAQALGQIGLACPARLGEHAPKFTQANVAAAIGRVHDWQAYLRSSTVQCRIREYLNQESKR